ncbi:ADC synthase [Boletus reticuloceps]|uniref:aminodeoxychorismate synthase n=1 Tax=Boletus reticuloceps TaxID=495285 RepID=A0A8I3AD26_9AGAM|nr:ADC synthase [Boletus reticuloceps]
MVPERILLVDSYDSFTFNLASLCRKAAPSSQIHIIKNDELSLPELLPFLQYFSAIIVGPGPGSPDVAADIGVVKHLWKLDERHLLPIFGVCLGLQSLATECGATIKRLPVVKHGQVSVVEHTGTEIFKGVKLRVLAWATDDLGIEKTVMAVKHTRHPFWAVQYHPESVLTRGGGVEVMMNFWRLARCWNAAQDRHIHSWDSSSAARFGSPWPNPHPPLASTYPSAQGTVLTSSLHLPGANTVAICEAFGAKDETSPFVVLESLAQPGRYTIIGCLRSSSPHITYSIGDSFVSLRTGDSVSHILLEPHDIWSWLSSFMSERKACNGLSDLPFWGGLIGYLSYELGVESLGVPSTAAPLEKRHPDVNLVFVERSIVLDGKTDIIYLQSIIDDDKEWLAEVTAALKLSVRDYTTHPHNNAPSSTKVRPNAATVVLPDKELYISRINIAKEYLYAGDSYELCLTANTRIILNDSITDNVIQHSSSWERYKHLRELNPAPHSGFLRLHPTTLLASSPERFLSFSRPPRSTYQLRPIKGTVRKGPGITRAVAEEALRGSVKEVAENLMIVDLIRHDLHNVVGEDVDVTQFCKVEEYKTVWQLVSVIQGRPAKGVDELDDQRANGALGWELLRRSLPAGSMTGAPKKRSVKILKTLEDNERGVYSGVFGYWCVGGGGDWSVTIRSGFKYDDRYSQMSSQSAESVSTTDPHIEEWVVGAGGAITALSDPQAEWEEMTVKLQSVLRVFGAAIPHAN